MPIHTQILEGNLVSSTCEHDSLLDFGVNVFLSEDATRSRCTPSVCYLVSSKILFSRGAQGDSRTLHGTSRYVGENVVAKAMVVSL